MQKNQNKTPKQTNQKKPKKPQQKTKPEKASQKISQWKQTSQQTKRSSKLEIFLESKDINTKLTLESKSLQVS